MSNTKRYNGWCNYETWLVNIIFGDSFFEMLKDGCSLDCLQQGVSDHLDTLFKEHTDMEHAMKKAFLKQVAFHELYEIIEESVRNEDCEETICRRQNNETIN